MQEGSQTLRSGLEAVGSNVAVSAEAVEAKDRAPVLWDERDLRHLTALRADSRVHLAGVAPAEAGEGAVAHVVMAGTAPAGPVLPAGATAGVATLGFIKKAAGGVEGLLSAGEIKTCGAFAANQDAIDVWQIATPQAGKGVWAARTSAWRQYRVGETGNQSGCGPYF